MKRIKILGVGLAGIFLLFTVIGLIMPSSVKISRGVMIAAPTENILPFISQLNQWPQWASWLQSNQGMLITVATDAESPFLEWRQAAAVQKGVIRISESKPQSVRLLISFPGMNKAEGTLQVSTGSDGNTEVIWLLEYPLRWYPWERFEGIFMDTILGSLQEQSLNRLKTLAENKDRAMLVYP
ncbi:MAG: SRPBCC family protein [Bacteroidetes bacterium]|nr:SRPBCC family protein [Bacteroidota bacterium]